jgi:hypothetical protein
VPVAIGSSRFVLCKLSACNLGLCRSTATHLLTTNLSAVLSLSSPSAFKSNSIGSVACRAAKILLKKIAPQYVCKKLWYGIWFVACNQSVKLLIPIIDRQTLEVKLPILDTCFLFHLESKIE